MPEALKASANGPQGGGERGIWLIAATGAVLSAVVIVWLFSRAPVPPAGAPARPAPAVGLTRLNGSAADALVREQAELFDPTPLFLPTRWNAQPRGLPSDAAREPGTAFSDFPSKLAFVESALALNFPASVAMPARPVEALGVGTPVRPLLGLGRVDLTTEPLAARGGFIEVQSAGTGERILAQALAATAPAGDWAPLEFLVAINAAGLVGPPQLTRSSGSDPVDAYFRTFLVENFRVGVRLPPGFFRVSIGP